jgi:6-phosphogluconolactonase
MNPEIIVQPDSNAVVEAAAELFLQVANESINARGRFLVALAGGSTPRALHQKFSTEHYRSRLDWSRVHIFFGDERAVPLGHEYSNGRMAQESLLDHVPIPTPNIHFMRGDALPLEEAAREYGLLLQLFGTSLDLILLGMGNDGHTASLFPHTPQLREAKHRCVATDVSPTEPQLPRVTLTFPALNAARNVLVLVTGAEKAERVAQVLEALRSSTRNVEELPITGVQPTDGTLTWMLDEAAARLSMPQS